MSLNWQAEDVVLPYRTITVKHTNGKEESQLHPVLERLIWNTMIIGGDYGQMKEDDLKLRMALMNRLDPELFVLQFGEGHTDLLFRVPCIQNKKMAEVLGLDDTQLVPFDEYWKELGFYWDKCELQEKGGIKVYITPDQVWKYYRGLHTNADRKTFKKWSKGYFESVQRESLRKYDRHLSELKGNNE